MAMHSEAIPVFCHNCINVGMPRGKILEGLNGGLLQRSPLLIGPRLVLVR